MKRRFKISIILIVAACFLILLTGTRGGLSYFSPATLEYEVQSEYAVLNGAFPIYRSRRDPAANELCEHLRKSGHVEIEAGPARRWEQVFHWNAAWKDGEGPLYEALIRNQGRIVEWSEADPARARIYWSEGFRLLRSEKEIERWAGVEIINSCWRSRSITELNPRIADVKAAHGL